MTAVDRRQFISVVGTTGLGAGAVYFAYQLDQGNVELPGETAAVSAKVDESAESFEFEAERGDDIHISIEEEEESDRRRGELTLRDPDGAEVVESRLSSSGTTMERHTAEREGTYSLTVAPRGARVRVSVSVSDPDD